MNAVAHNPVRGRWRAAGAIPVAASALCLFAAAPPTEVGRLSDPDPAIREAAMADVAAALDDPAGSGPLREALQGAAESDDPELSRRAQALLLQERLGLVPGLDDAIVSDAWTARWAPSPAGRSRARQSLAAAVPASAPVVARLLVDLLDESDEADPPLIRPGEAERNQALTELWPQQRFAIPLIASILRERGRLDVARAWISTIATGTGDPLAAQHLAWIAAADGNLNDLIDQWQRRVRQAPSASARRTLVTLLRRADRPVPPELFPEPADARREALRREVAALIGAEAAPDTAPTLPERDGDGDDATLRLLIDAVLASLEEDQATRTTPDPALREHVEELLREHGDPARRDRGVGPSPEEELQARHLAIASMAVGRLDAALRVAEPVFPSAALTVLHRRMEFAQAHRLAETAAEWPEEIGRQLRVTSMSLRQELGQRGVRVATPPRLTPWGKGVVEAADAFRKGEWAAAHPRMAELARADPAQPGYAWGAAVAAREADGTAGAPDAAIAAALEMPLGDAWLRRDLAEVLWMLGRTDEALLQYRQAARLSLGEDAGAALTTVYAGRLAETGQWQRAIEAFQAAILLLALDPPAPGFSDTWLYFALFSHANIEHARMRLALEAGDLPSAIAHRDAALALLPGFSDPTIDLVAWHDARGETDKAMQVFNDGFLPLMKTSANWPQSPVLANQAAWVAARCGRRLDTALTLARTAVTNDPRSAACLDTLAEIHLMRGEGERAVSLMWQVVALAEGESRFSDYVLRLASIQHRAAAGTDREGM